MSNFFFYIFPRSGKKIFKLFANFEGTSSSVPRAENHALRFYWYFMLLTAFTGSTLAQMLVDGFVKGKWRWRFDLEYPRSTMLMLLIYLGQALRVKLGMVYKM